MDWQGSARQYALGILSIMAIRWWPELVLHLSGVSIRMVGKSERWRRILMWPDFLQNKIKMASASFLWLASQIPKYQFHCFLLIKEVAKDSPNSRAGVRDGLVSSLYLRSSMWAQGGKKHYHWRLCTTQDDFNIPPLPRVCCLKWFWWVSPLAVCPWTIYRRHWCREGISLFTS